MASCATITVRARPASACPSRTSQRSCGGAMRTSSRLSARRQCSRSSMVPKPPMQPCTFHPRQDCCIPKCCPPPLPKCPIGIYVERTKPIRPDRYYEPLMAPFNGLTTYRENYYLKCIQRGQSFKPASTFDPSSAKLEGLTTYNEAYTPKPMYPYRKPVWAKTAEFDPSEAKMDGISTYRNDYNGCMAERAKSLKPLAQFDPSSAPLDDKTTYRTTFIPYCPYQYQYAKQPMFKKIGGGDISCAPLDGITTYRADYWPKQIMKTKSMKPSIRAAFSDAKFADITTYRNDFIPFHFEKCSSGPCIPAEIYTEMYPPCGIFACGAEPDAQPQRLEDPCPAPCRLEVSANHIPAECKNCEAGEPSAQPCA